MNAYNKKKCGTLLLALPWEDNNVKNLCIGSFSGYHYTFIYVFLDLLALDTIYGLPSTSK